MVALPLMSDNKDERVVLNQPDTSCHSFLCLPLQPPLNNYMLLTEQLRAQTYVQLCIWQRAIRNFNWNVPVLAEFCFSCTLSKFKPKQRNSKILCHSSSQTSYDWKIKLWLQVDGKVRQGECRVETFFFLVCTL